jgi:pseudouridine synthase
MTRQRLQKVLAAAGVDSRRKCEELILSGAVSVNSQVVDTLPAFVDPQIDIITVHGKRIHAEQKVYFLLNKPKGVICTNYDPQGRKTAIDLIPVQQRIFCVGRLDADTTGLLILTNDSELANRLTHPRYRLPKTYVVEVKGRIDDQTVETLKKGIRLAEGKTAEASVKLLRSGHQQSRFIGITIRQGLNRQIRSMLAKLDLPVKSLKRTRIGTITDRGLGIGKFRALIGTEVAYLKNATAGESADTQLTMKNKAGF